MKKVPNPLILLSLLFLFFTASISAQTFTAEGITGSGDSTVFQVDYPKLVEKTKAQPTPPFYQHLYLFGDGNFLYSSSSTEDTVQHLFQGSPATGVLPNFFPRAYSNGVYSEDEDMPPNLKINGFTPSNGALTPIIPTQIVDSLRYVKIMRNVQVKPGDNFVSILSVRNPTETFFTGQLYFFFDGRLREVSQKGTRELVDYSVFDIRENFTHQVQASPQSYYYSNLPGNLGNQYRRMMMMRVNELAPGAEVHYFVDMEGDETMTKYFADTTMAEMDFAVALGSFTDDINIVVPDSLSNKLASLDLNTAFSQLDQAGAIPDSLKNYSISTDTSALAFPTQGPGLNALAIVDYYESTATLVKSHDPNYLLMHACACEEEQDLYQVFTTIECENNGYGETSNIYIDMKLPDGITFDQVVATPVKYHPFSGPADQISLVKITDDSIRWQLLNFGIEGTPLHGVGDPRTYARVQFHMYSSVPPAQLDSTYACIRFDDLSNDPVCTIPVGVTFVSADDNPAGAVLNCGPGDCDGAPEPPVNLPWWLWVLLILFLIILIIWWRLRNN